MTAPITPRTDRLAPARTRSDAEARFAGLERRLIPVPGTDLACWHRPGDGTRWVLWLHGAAGNHLEWANQVDAFDGVDHLFLDLRGQGESTMHAGGRVTLADAIDDIPAVLDAYGAARAVLVGHSWGGNPAQELAHRSPERVDALVLVGSWGQFRRMSDTEARMIKAMTLAYRAVPWSLMARYCGRACSKVPETQALVADAVRATGREVYLDLGLTGYAAVREVDEYPVATPTLLIRGEHDAPSMLAPIYADLCARNPAAHEVVIPGTGHIPMLDTPDALNETIATLLSELPRA